MSNRRPTTLLLALAGIAVVSFALSAALDDNKGWNHPGQFVANIAWISTLLSVLAIVVTAIALLARGVRHHDTAG
jgi:hypothetical protein